MRAVKFGGGSVADATKLRAAGAWLARLRARAEPVTAIVSAMAGVTDGLLAVAESASRGDSGWKDELHALGARHRETYRALSGDLPHAFTEQWADVEREALDLARRATLWGERARELAVARFSGWGEPLAVGLLAEAVSAAGAAAFPLTDAPILLRSREQAGVTPEPSALASRAWLLPRLGMPVMRGAIPILPGYIARDADGRLTTLGRNSSDLTAAVIAAALGATSLTIYSDVFGIFTADPHVASDARLLPALTYDEAARIARLGAKALHPRAVEPLEVTAIPLELRAASAPDAPGTDIGSAGRIMRQRSRPMAWVVTGRPATTADMVDVTAIRLPAWPNDADDCDCAAGVAIECEHAGLVPSTVARDEIAVTVARAQANETVRALHTALVACADRHTLAGVAAGA
jgi:aspartate kinase